LKLHRFVWWVDPDNKAYPHKTKASWERSPHGWGRRLTGRCDPLCLVRAGAQGVAVSTRDRGAMPVDFAKTPSQRFKATYPAKEIDHGKDRRWGSPVGKWWCNVRKSALGARAL